MSFNFKWPTFSAQFHADAAQTLNSALNRGPKPKVIADDIRVEEICMGSVPPELEILEIGDLSTDRFRGIFRLTYAGDAYLVLSTKVQANPLTRPGAHAHGSASAASDGLTGLGPIGSGVLAPPSRGILFAAAPLIVPMRLRLSSVRLRAIVVLVISRQKGITLVFKNDPLESVEVSSTFDSVAVIAKYLQQEIEGQLREMFREDLPGIIHRLSQRWLSGDRGSGDGESKGAAAATSNGPATVTTAGSSPAPEPPRGLPRSTSEPRVPRAPPAPAPSLNGTPVARRKTSVSKAASAAGAGPASKLASSPPRSAARPRRHTKSASTTGVPFSRGSRAASTSPDDALDSTFMPSASPLDDIISYDPTYGLRPDEIRIDGSSQFSGLSKLVRERTGGLKDLMRGEDDAGEEEEGLGAAPSATPRRKRTTSAASYVVSDRTRSRESEGTASFGRSRRDEDSPAAVALELDSLREDYEASGLDLEDEEPALDHVGEDEDDVPDYVAPRLRTDSASSRLQAHAAQGSDSELESSDQEASTEDEETTEDEDEEEEDPNIVALGLDISSRRPASTSGGRSQAASSKGAATVGGRRRSGSSASQQQHTATSPRSRHRSSASVSGATEFETIPAVGGGVIQRPRTYHIASQVRAPEPEYDVDAVDEEEGSMTIRRGAKSQSGRTAGGSSRTFTVRGPNGGVNGGTSTLNSPNIDEVDSDDEAWRGGRGHGQQLESPVELEERAYFDGSGESSEGRSRSAESLATLEPEAMDPRSLAYKNALYRQRYGGLYRAGYGGAESERESSAESGSSGDMWGQAAAARAARMAGLGGSRTSTAPTSYRASTATTTAGSYSSPPPGERTSTPPLQKLTAPQQQSGGGGSQWASPATVKPVLSRATSAHSSPAQPQASRPRMTSHASASYLDLVNSNRTLSPFTRDLDMRGTMVRSGLGSGSERGGAVSGASSSAAGSGGGRHPGTASASVMRAREQQADWRLRAARSAPASDAGGSTRSADDAPRPVVANRRRTFKVGAKAQPLPQQPEGDFRSGSASPLRQGIVSAPLSRASSSTSWSRGDTASEASSWEALQHRREAQRAAAAAAEAATSRAPRYDEKEAQHKANAVEREKRIKAARRRSANGRMWVPPDTIRE